MQYHLKKNGEYEGVFRAVNKNFAFVDVGLNLDDKISVYISIDDTKFSLDNDKVLVKITKEQTENKSPEGKVIKILERNNDEIIGVYKNCGDYGFVMPTNKKIGFDVHINKKFKNNATSDSIVVAKLISSNTQSKNPEGVIISIIGNKHNPNAQILSIVKEYKIRYEFSKKILDDANRMAVDISDEDLIYRKDLRNLLTITIDGEDARDLDDAISFEILNDGKKKLYVSIADVSHYVKEDSSIDNEAKLRGNSVYLVDRVIPMIPQVLSNGLCSLNENEDRLTLTCEITYDENNEVVDSCVYESVINVNKRMSYNGVHLILNNLDLQDNEEMESYASYKDFLHNLLDLSIAIRNKREKNGCVDFNLKESKIIVDENCFPVKIDKYERFEAHKMIEDFMVSANEEVAKEYYFKELPFLYRTHEECDKEKMEKLSFFLSQFGLSLQHKNKIHPKQLQQVLNKVQNKDYQYLVEKMILRAMKQAKYTSELIGHFALGLKYYTHFTSPIRRYCDLQIHRIIKEDLHSKMDEKRIIHYNKILNDIAHRISFNERTAIDCEREVDDLKKCEYMEQYIGTKFVGIISSVTNFGCYVELDNTIEGLIPIRSLKDDFYIFDEINMKLVGERTNRVLSLGMKVEIIVDNISKELRQIDFLLVKKYNGKVDFK